MIAVDSLQPSVYETLTGAHPGMLPRVLKNLEAVRRIYADTTEVLGDVHVLRLAINMTICSLNVTEIADIKALAGSDIYFICNPLARQGNAVGNWGSLVRTQDEPEHFAVLAARNSESGGPLTLNAEGLCGYSISGIGVGPYGHYMTCAYTSRTNGLLGTIWERTLKHAFEFKVQSEGDHYRADGTVPCLVRAKSFDRYLATLSSHGQDSRTIVEPTATTAISPATQLITIQAN